MAPRSALTTNVTPRIPLHIKESEDGPEGAHAGRRDGVPQACDQQCCQGGGLVLDELGVAALRAVESHGLLILALGGGVGRWVVYFCRFAQCACVEGMGHVHEEG